MEINSTSSLSQIQALLNSQGVNNNISANNSASTFSAIFEEMLKKASAEGSSGITTSKTSTQDKTNAVKGIDSLSLTPQNMVKILQLMSMESLFSTSNVSEIGSVDEDSTSALTNDGLGGLGSNSNDLSQMLQMISEGLKNETSGSSYSSEPSNYNL